MASRLTRRLLADSAPSWPGLSRPSTSSTRQDVDARHKAGHDESSYARAALTRRALLQAGAGTACLIATPYLARAQGADAVKISLEFRIYGGNAPLFLAAENGIFGNSAS